MNIITHKFNQISTNLIFSLKNKEINSIVGRVRLKFTHSQVCHYVQIIFEHSVNHKSFYYLFKNSNLSIQYSCFMSNIKLFSKLFKFLFSKINEKLGIKPSKLLNIVDTTLIEEKKLNFINSNDWNCGRVTTRINNLSKAKTKLYTCGSKGLVFCNRFGQIYAANLLNINHSDQNILKDHTFYLKELKGILLADRGFNNKAIRHRLSHMKTSVFEPNQAICRLISPPHYKTKEKLSKKESKLYKRRWKIETIFQNLKHNYSENKLNLTGKYTKIIKEAKFYSTLINFNLTTI